MPELLPILLILGGLGVAGLLAIFFGLPLLLQVGSLLEAFNILGTGVDEYFNRPGLARSCCLFGCLLLIGGCTAMCVGVFTLWNCLTSVTPADLCRFIGR